MSPTELDEVGAHVSAQGGVCRAPERAAALGAAVLQLFTKQPSRWADPSLGEEDVDRFLDAREAHRITCAGSHDSYLINLASPDVELREKSRRAFQAELERCAALRLDFLVTHPGNATDRNIDAGLTRNAQEITRCLEAVEGSTRVLLELTAGSGTSVGGSFENLATLLERIPAPLQGRLGVCFDTCHAYSAGYDLVDDYDGVWNDFDRRIGLERLGLIHVNDSKHPLGSHKDRHECIGDGALGSEPFRRLMLDDRLRGVVKILETPKGDDPVAGDLENLARLKGFRTG